MKYPVLIYDADCGFCTRSVRVILRLNARRAFVALPYQTAGLLASVGLTEEQTQSAAWFVDADGTRHRGAGAINRALNQSGGVWRAVAWLYRLPLIRPLQDAVYAWVARNRFLMPGSTAACRIEPKPTTQAKA